MEEKGFNYYRDTSPEEFLADLRAILVDGDNMCPVRLIEEVNYMTSQFIEAQIAEEGEEK
jgi:hypothetical protein